jgi:hypothetical protein
VQIQKVCLQRAFVITCRGSASPPAPESIETAYRNSRNFQFPPAAALVDNKLATAVEHAFRASKIAWHFDKEGGIGPS